MCVCVCVCVRVRVGGSRLQAAGAGVQVGGGQGLLVQALLGPVQEVLPHLLTVPADPATHTQNIS